jgi:hypothetical protein
MLNCSGRNFLCYTRYRYWPKKRNTTIVWIENDKTSVLIARYGAFVLNFNQEPQHRTQQSMCNSHLFLFLIPQKRFTVSAITVKFLHGSLESLNHFCGVYSITQYVNHKREVSQISHNY